ncbi:MAG: PEP-CTERM sorting domain-containing protein [Cyanobacteria bacterium J06627_32]
MVGPVLSLSCRKCVGAFPFVTVAGFLWATQLPMAQQAVAVPLSPNPNPPGSSLFFEGLNDSVLVENESPFENAGFVGFEANAAFVNSAFFNNSGAFSLANDAIFRNESTFENLGSLNLSEGLVANAGRLNNRGGLNTQSGGSDLIVNEGFFNNIGKVDLNVALLENKETFNNAGLVSLNIASIENAGMIENAGRIEQKFELADISNSTGSTFLNRGEVRKVQLENEGLFVNRGIYNADGQGAKRFFNGASGTFINNGTATVSTQLGTGGRSQFANKGLLKGTGSFSSVNGSGPGLVLSGGTIAPGGLFDSDTVVDTAGMLTFEGDVTLSEESILDISIGGLEENAFDVLKVVDGSAWLLGGRVSFSLLDDFDIDAALDPGDSRSLSFLSADSGVVETGSKFDFSQIASEGLSFSVVQADGALLLNIEKGTVPDNPVPDNPVPVEPVPVEPTVPEIPVDSVPDSGDSSGPVVSPGMPTGPAPRSVPEPSVLLGFLAVGGLGLRTRP